MAGLTVLLQKQLEASSKKAARWLLRDNIDDPSCGRCAALRSGAVRYKHHVCRSEPPHEWTGFTPITQPLLEGGPPGGAVLVFGWLKYLLAYGNPHQPTVGIGHIATGYLYINNAFSKASWDRQNCWDGVIDEHPGAQMTLGPWHRTAALMRATVDDAARLITPSALGKSGPLRLPRVNTSPVPGHGPPFDLGEL